MSKMRVVICGITGAQGGAVYDALKEETKTYELIGFSRRQHGDWTEKYPGLTRMEVGDLLDVASLQRIFQGVDVVFGVTQPWNADYTSADCRAEVQQGANILQACVDQNVKHLIFTSALHDGVRTGIPHVDSKMEIEDALVKAKKDGRLKQCTILHPVQFMDNIGGLYLPVFPTSRKIRGFVDGDAQVPYVAVRDIGRVSRAILDHPEKLDAKSGNASGSIPIIPVVSDLKSGFEMAEVMTKIHNKSGTNSGKPFQYTALPRLLVRLFSKEFYLMRVYFEANGRDPKVCEQRRNDIQQIAELIGDTTTTLEVYVEGKGSTIFDVGSQEEETSSRRMKQVAIGALVATTAAALSFVYFGSPRQSTTKASHTK